MGLKWIDFWQKYRLIKIENDSDLLFQVGKTVKGIPISERQLKTIVESVHDNLDLQEDNLLVDLCCGNGILTRNFQVYVKQVVGIDFSEPFITNARIYSKAENIEYYCNDINDLSVLDEFGDFGTAKVLLYDALAYFSKGELEEILRTLSKRFKGDFMLYIGSILDVKRKSQFYDTPSRKILSIFDRFSRGKGIGKWWSIEEINEIASRNKLKCKLVPQDKELHTAHYRFDVIISPDK